MLIFKWTLLHLGRTQEHPMGGHDDLSSHSTFHGINSHILPPKISNANSSLIAPRECTSLAPRLPPFLNFQLLAACFLHNRLLLLQLSLGLQLPSALNTKPTLEDLADLLKSHALNPRVAEVNGSPAEEADGGGEAETA